MWLFCELNFDALVLIMHTRNAVVWTIVGVFIIYYHAFLPKELGKDMERA